MRRSTRTWLTAAGCMVAAGLLIFAIGSGMGGFHTVRDWIENGELSWNFGFYPWGWRWGTGSSVKFDDRYPVYEGTVSRARIEGAERIENLIFDVGGCRVEIRASEDDDYWFASEDAKEYQCFAENNSLELRVKGGSWVGNRNAEHVITLWLPKEATYQRIDLDIGGGELDVETLFGDAVSIDVGAGSIEADELSGGQLVLELGAGEIVLQSVEADRFAVNIGAGAAAVTTLSARELEVEIGAGQLVIEDSTLENADISVSMGQIRYQGTVTGDLDADCSMGQISLELNGKKEDHNYEVDCSMGEINLGGESYSGMGSSRTIDNGSASSFELDCSMGNIDVRFKD